MKNSTWNKGVKVVEVVLLVALVVALLLGVIRALDMITVYAQ